MVRELSAYTSVFGPFTQMLRESAQKDERESIKKLQESERLKQASIERVQKWYIDNGHEPPTYDVLSKKFDEEKKKWQQKIDAEKGPVDSFQSSLSGGSGGKVARAV